MISGQSPRIQWQRNPEGQIRTIEEAKAIAKQWGVAIPDDVNFFEDELKELHETFTACGPRVDKPAGSTVYWNDLVHDKTGKVPFRVWPGILGSDEAIVGVLAHEVFELEMLRPLLEQGVTMIEDFIAHTRPGNPGNLHDRAWDLADEIVQRMRTKGKS
ncbi:MAG: hypothetical protein HY040_14750 [Planctomycetes bacterium]|nr:hypothetical protein [Planctomycetota bacterium]